jgi:hypothetical protein
MDDGKADMTTGKISGNEGGREDIGISKVVVVFSKAGNVRQFLIIREQRMLK